MEKENEKLKQENEKLRVENEGLKKQVKKLKKELERLQKKKKKVPAFVKKNKPKKEAKKTRKKRAAEHNKGRRRETRTRIEKHQLEKCPTCGEKLKRHQESYSRQIIDIPEPQPVEVVEHQMKKGWCEGCQKWHMPKAGWEESIGQGRIGVRLLGLVGYMRSVLRLPYRQIQAFLESVHRVNLSVGELVNLARKVGEGLKEELAVIKQQARGSPHLHMDETGWREDGQNGYIWCLVTETPQPIHYFEYHHSRASGIVTELLGDEFSGTLVSDFYAAYNIYQGPHQRCWVHLLCDLSKLREDHPHDESIVAWCLGVKFLYRHARESVQKLATFADRQVFVTQLTEMARLFGLMYAQVDHPCRAVAKRLLRHMDELFLFVLHPDLAADNNLAERALRSLVVQRKISGGSRSQSGSQTCMQLATLFQTWLARGSNPLHQCWYLLGYSPLWSSLS